MVTSAAVILQPGKVEVHAIPDGVPPSYLRFMRPKKPIFARPGDIDETASLDLETIRVSRHRLFGFSVGLAYWHESWSDEWAIDELREWEWPGWKNDPNRRKQYYGDFIVDENQPARENERRPIESKSVRRPRSGNESVVLVVYESVPQRGLDSGSDGYSWNDRVFPLERGVSGGHASNLPGEDGD